MNGTTLEPSEGGRALRWRDGTWSDLCVSVSVSVCVCVCVCFCLCIVQQWDMPARVPAACQLLGAAYSLWATCVITCCLCWELNASLNVCAPVRVHASIYTSKVACVCARVCVLGPLHLFSRVGSAQTWGVEGCLFNVTFTSDAVTQLAVYFRAHDNDLGRQSVTLTLTRSTG